MAENVLTAHGVVHTVVISVSQLLCFCCRCQTWI